MERPTSHIPARVSPEFAFRCSASQPELVHYCKPSVSNYCVSDPGLGTGTHRPESFSILSSRHSQVGKEAQTMRVAALEANPVKEQIITYSGVPDRRHPALSHLITNSELTPSLAN